MCAPPSTYKHHRKRSIRQQWVFIICAALLNVAQIWRTNYFSLALLPSSSLGTASFDPSRTSRGLQNALTSSISLSYHPLAVKYDFESNTVRVLASSALRTATTSHNQVTTNKNNATRHEINQAASSRKCKPMHEWQTHSYPTCNTFHELDIAAESVDGSFSLVACGGHRCAFQINNERQSLALKLPKRGDGEEGFRPYVYERARKDGMTMERLTSSPNIVTTYGYCGLSQVNEYASGGSMRDLIEWSRGKGGGAIIRHLNKPLKMSPLDKLRIGIQVITAVAELHGFEEDGVASVTHNDLNPDQFVLIDGVYKLNDFHLSYFLERRNDNQAEPGICHQPMGINSFIRKHHAPEETYRGKAVDNVKADDYVAGNLMYYVLTSKWIFEGIGSEKGIKKLRNGERSPFPEHIQNSTDPADKAMMRGIQMLWTHNVEERPSARNVSQYLLGELERITGSQPKDGVVRVSVPPFPDGWDYMERDLSWYDNLEDSEDVEDSTEDSSTSEEGDESTAGSSDESSSDDDEERSDERWFG